MNTIEFPKVEKGVPPPPMALRKHRERALPPWRVFLAGLVAGDSFKALEPSLDALRGHARVLGIELLAQRTGERADHNTPIVRVWRV